MRPGRRVEPDGQGSLADVRSSPTVPAYHCAERHGGAGISPADDTWAVAVLLYFLLTGALPFPGNSAAEVSGRIGAGPPPPLGSHGRADPVLQSILDAHLGYRPGSPRIARGRAAPGVGAVATAAQLAALPPLEEAATETSGDTYDSYDSDAGDDDDDEDVATVMRDFTDLRKEIAAERAARPLPAAGMPAVRPQPAAQAQPAPLPGAAAHHPRPARPQLPGQHRLTRRERCSNHERNERSRWVRWQRQRPIDAQPGGVSPRQ